MLTKIQNILTVVNQLTNLNILKLYWEWGHSEDVAISHYCILSQENPEYQITFNKTIISKSFINTTILYSIFDDLEGAEIITYNNDTKEINTHLLPDTLNQKLDIIYDHLLNFKLSTIWK